ncbi:MAG: hypothetical protein OXG37_04590 [Actinomycetia bacterium]|nr:hypothetical protein [Actinomycetes bacterium]
MAHPDVWNIDGIRARIAEARGILDAAGRRLAVAASSGLPVAERAKAASEARREVGQVEAELGRLERLLEK